MASGTGAPTKGGPSPSQAPMRMPFLSSARWHTEAAQFDVSVTPTTSTQMIGPFDVPAGGFFRFLWILVTSSGGTVGPGTAGNGFPYNVFQQVQLADVNGAQIGGPFGGVLAGGYSLYVANLHGGYDFTDDPSLDPTYSATAAAPAFLIKIPLEYHGSGRGALPNQDSSSKYKLTAFINNIASIYGTAPTTPATLRIRGFLDAWTMPGPEDMMGRPQAQVPPGYGTTQYLSSYSVPLVTGQNIIPIRRVGNRIRGLYFNFTKAGVPATLAQMPDPVELDWDQRVLHVEPLAVRQARIARSLNTNTTGAAGVKNYPTNIVAYSFAHNVDYGIGGIGPEMFLPTVQGTRLDAIFTVPAAGADTVEVIINDVAGAEIDSNSRYMESSASTFHPAVGGPVVAP